MSTTRRTVKSGFETTSYPREGTNEPYYFNVRHDFAKNDRQASSPEREQTKQDLENEEPKAEDFVNKTSFHGIGYAYHAKSRLEQSFWCIVCLSMLGLIAYEIYAVVNDYVDHPYTTSVGQEQRTSMEIPDIVFCTHHRLTRDFMQKHNLSRQLVEYMNSVFAERALFELHPSENELTALEAEYQALKARAGYENMDHIIMDSWITCEEIFPWCFYAGRDLEGGCCSHAHRFMMSEGPCYAMDFINASSHISGIALQYHGGPAHGVSIVVDLQPAQLAKTLFNTDMGFGLSFHIGHPHLDHNPLPFDNHKLTVPPGTVAYIKLHRKEQNRQINCIKAHDGLTLQHFPGYETQACLYECVLNATLAACGCVPLGHNVSQYFIGDEHYCEPYESMTCFRPLMYDVNTDLYQSPEASEAFYEGLLTCDHKCHLLCESSHYDAEVLYSAFPNPASLPIFKEYINKSDAERTGENHSSYDYDVSQRFVVANIYFADIEVEVSREVTTATVNELVSNIGGLASLFSGCSVITLIHLCIFLLAYCKSKGIQESRDS